MQTTPEAKAEPSRKSEVIPLRLPLPLAEWVESVAEKEQITRAEVIRLLVRKAKTEAERLSAKGVEAPLSSPLKVASAKGTGRVDPTPRARKDTRRSLVGAGR